MNLFIILSTVCFASDVNYIHVSEPGYWDLKHTSPYCVLIARISESSATVKGEINYEVIQRIGSDKSPCIEWVLPEFQAYTTYPSSSPFHRRKPYDHVPPLK